MSSGSWLFMLERFDIGLVHIDRHLRVVGMNDYGRRCLPVEEKLPFGKLVTSFHPKASRAKLQFLIGQAELGPPCFREHDSATGANSSYVVAVR